MSGLFNSNGSNEGLSGRMNEYSGVGSSVSGAVVAVIVTVLVVIIVLGYFVYRFMVSSLKATELTSSVVHCRSGFKTLESSKLPALTNGREWTLSYWLYVDSATHTTSDKNILTFGKDLESASFLAVLDNNLNRLYMVFKTTSSGTVPAITALNTFKQGNRPESHIIVPVEYVPLSRWVMITAVVDQDTVTLYVDNNIYSVVSSARFKKGSIIADPDQGGIIIGSASNGADAYLSKLKFYNYGISVFDVRAHYRSGPGSSGILGWLGLGKYKLQWPIVSATS